MRRVPRRPKLKLTPEARRERFWRFTRGLASTVATAALAVLVVIATLLIVLGRGPEPVQVPSVKGSTVEDAQRVLESVGLEGQEVSRIYHDRVALGLVISQRPQAGKYVKQGRMIELAVSRGPKSVPVPRVVGKTLSQAENLLGQKYLRVGRVRRQASSEPFDTVMEQDPAAGAKVGRDAEINLVVSGGSQYGTWKSPGGQTWVFRTLHLVVPAGPSLQRVKVVLETRGREQVIFNEIQRPGDGVSLQIHGERRAKVKVFVEEKKVFDQRL